MLTWFKSELQWLKVRGWLFREKFDAALAGLQELEVLQPQDFRLKLQKALIFLRQGNYAEAGIALAAAEQLAPQSALVLLYLGVLALEEDDPARAEEKLQQALRVCPRNTLARNWLALLQFMQGKASEAFNYWKKYGISCNSYFIGKFLIEIEKGKLGARS
jgi:Flp pilus assembly protein TadD